MKLALKVTPGARRSEVLGWEDYPQVGRVLKVRIAAPPVDGKANKVLVALLAEALGLPRSAVSVVHGASGRVKLVELPEGTDLSRLS